MKASRLAHDFAGVRASVAKMTDNYFVKFYAKLVAELIVAGTLVGCGEPKRHVVAQAPSPNGRLIAVVEEEESVPLSETDSLVIVRPIGRPADDNDVVFRGGDMSGRGYGPLNVAWRDKSNLQVGYCSGYIKVFRNHWIDTRNVTSPQVVVHLNEEAEGDWPSMTPVDQRAAQPPCR